MLNYLVLGVTLNYFVRVMTLNNTCRVHYVKMPHRVYDVKLLRLGVCLPFMCYGAVKQQLTHCSVSVHR